MSAFEDFVQVELPRRPWVLNDPAEETVPVRRGPGPRRLEFVSMNDGEVLGKVGGIIQGVDVSSLAIKSYIHTQTVPDVGWFITHNLNSEDYVAFVVDALGNQIIPDNIVAMDADTIEIDFNSQQTGKVVIIFAS